MLRRRMRRHRERRGELRNLRASMYARPDLPEWSLRAAVTRGGSWRLPHRPRENPRPGHRRAKGRVAFALLPGTVRPKGTSLKPQGANVPKAFDFNNAIHSMIEQAVAEAMKPYARLLRDSKPVKRGPGRPSKVAPVAMTFSVGDRVSYKQGRGTFDARVASVDLAKVLYGLVRVSDGKKVARPAAKVGRAVGIVATAEKTAPRRPKRRGSVTKKLARAAVKPGQKVTYNQGRGTFEAKVIRVDVKRGLVTVERMKDGKRVVRPATKITAG